MSKELPILYDTKAYGRNALCSGYKVFPNGKKCSGCSDCTKRKGYAVHSTVGLSVSEALNANHTLISIKKK